MKSKLLEISKNLKEQDNRCTADPIFCVQVCKRVAPILPSYSNEVCFLDNENQEVYYPDSPDPERWKELRKLYDEAEFPKNIEVGGFYEIWETVQTFFTQKGAEDYLRINGHNLQYGFGTRIYVESLYRNEEMKTIREFLKNHD